LGEKHNGNTKHGQSIHFEPPAEPTEFLKVFAALSAALRRKLAKLQLVLLLNEIIPQLMAKPRDDLQKDRTRFLSVLPVN